MTQVDQNQEFIEWLNQCLNKGDVQSALLGLYQRVEKFPYDHLAYIVLCQLSIKLQDLSILNKILTTALEHSENLQEPLFEIGRVYASLGDLECARKIFEENTRVNPAHANSILELARLARISGNINQAFKNYGLLTQVVPSSAEAWSAIGLIAMNSGNYEAGMAALKKARKLLAGELDDFYTAASLAVAHKPTDPEGHICLSSALYSRKNYIDAHKSIQTALKLDPDNIDAYYLSAELYYFGGDFPTAEKMLIERHKVKKRKAIGLGLDKLGIRFIGDDFVGSIGHISQMEYFFKMEIMELLPKARTLIFPGDSCGNKHLLGYWGQYAYILAAEEEREAYQSLKKYLEQNIFCFETVDGEFLHMFQAQGYVQKRWEEQGRSHLLKLREDDYERGWARLEQLGVPRGSWFVTVHARDTGRLPNGKWKEPMRGARNAYIESYDLAMRTIIERGGYVVRMGDPNMTKLPKMDNVVDYAHSDLREDWMDVFLLAENRFLLGSTSGPAQTPPLFGKPVANGNWVSLVIFPGPSNDLFIPKLLRSTQENRILSIGEQFGNIKLHYNENIEVAESLGLELVDSSAEDLRDLTIEMLDRCEDKYNYSSEDEVLQEKFKQIVKANDRTGNGRIGKEFLRKYAYLLE